MDLPTGISQARGLCKASSQPLPNVLMLVTELSSLGFLRQHTSSKAEDWKDQRTQGTGERILPLLGKVKAAEWAGMLLKVSCARPGG